MLTRFYRPLVCVQLTILLLALSAPSADAGDWPQWRGPNRNGQATSTGLLKKWPAEGPAVRWQVDRVGVGYSSISIVGNRIYTQGDLNGVEHVICLDTKDGSVVWAVQPGPLATLLANRLAKELQRLDTDKNGTINELEALKGFGWKFNDYDLPVKNEKQTPSEFAASRTARLFGFVDTDGDKILSFAEGNAARIDRFTNVDTRGEDVDVKVLAAERTAALLKELDKDKDKQVSRTESRGTALDRAFNRADIPAEGEKRGDQQLTEEEISKYLEKYEAGLDGKITPAELTAYYAKHHPFRDGNLTAAELSSIYGGYRNGMGNGPRGTPTVEGDSVFIEGGNGDVSCLDAATGKTTWHVNLSETFGGGRPGWGYSESPLLEDDLLVVTPGGKQGTMVALDKYTGKLKWQTKGVTQGAHYASAVATTIGGVRQVVQFARSNVFGVRLSSGELLWSYSNAANGTANCATPIIDGNHIFASSAYGVGGGLARINTVDGKQTSEEIYFEKRMANHHGGIVKVKDHMYGFGSGGLICMDFLTGEIAWRDRSVGKGSLIYADGMLYLLGENHQVAIAEATPEEYREHGRFKISSHGRPSWAHAAIAGETLYIRDQQSLTAYDISSD